MRNRNIETLIIVVLVLLIIVVSGTVYKNYNNSTDIILKDEAESKEASVETIEQAPAVVEETKQITVYICGYVEKPGNVTLDEGARLGDALAYVGGVLEEADMNAVNLAHKLYDEEMVYIPKKGEPAAANNNSGYSANDGYIISQTPDKVSINNATLAQLETLPGIGTATAEKIISYRTANGGFKNVEDIMNVPGIGEKKFESLKDFITK